MLKEKYSIISIAELYKFIKDFDLENLLSKDEHKVHFYIRNIHIYLFKLYTHIFYIYIYIARIFIGFILIYLY
jgi:hypothetical protein